MAQITRSFVEVRGVEMKLSNDLVVFSYLLPTRQINRFELSMGGMTSVMTHDTGRVDAIE